MSARAGIRRCLRSLPRSSVRRCSTCMPIASTTVPSTRSPVQTSSTPRWPCTEPRHANASISPRHAGVHPRLGVVDVVPFSPLGPAGFGNRRLDRLDEAIAARRTCLLLRSQRAISAWRAFVTARSVPCPRSGATCLCRPCPRHRTRSSQPASGACCVGARPCLIAYNLVISANVATAQDRIALLRSPERAGASGSSVEDEVHVSCNLIAPWSTGPAQVYDARLGDRGSRRANSNSWASFPAALLAGDQAKTRWARIDLSEEPHDRGAARRVVRLRRRRRCPGQRARGHGGHGDVHARSCLPRSRTSRHSRSRTRGNPLARRSRGRPLLPHASMSLAPGRNRSGIDAPCSSVVTPACQPWSPIAAMSASGCPRHPPLDAATAAAEMTTVELHRWHHDGIAEQGRNAQEQDLANFPRSPVRPVYGTRCSVAVADPTTLLGPTVLDEIDEHVVAELLRSGVEGAALVQFRHLLYETA